MAFIILPKYKTPRADLPYPAGQRWHTRRALRAGGHRLPPALELTPKRAPDAHVRRSSEVPFPKLWAGVSLRAWFIVLAGVPRAQAGPPSGHRLPVGPVVRAEPAGEGRFLVPA